MSWDVSCFLLSLCHARERWWVSLWLGLVLQYREREGDKHVVHCYLLSKMELGIVGESLGNAEIGIHPSMPLLISFYRSASGRLFACLADVACTLLPGCAGMHSSPAMPMKQKRVTFTAARVRLHRRRKSSGPQHDR